MKNLIGKVIGKAKTSNQGLFEKLNQQAVEVSREMRQAANNSKIKQLGEDVVDIGKKDKGIEGLVGENINDVQDMLGVKGIVVGKGYKRKR